MLFRSQTVLRQIALLLDLIYHKQGKAFNKPSYQLLEFVMPYDVYYWGNSLWTRYKKYRSTSQRKMN